MASVVSSFSAAEGDRGVFLIRKKSAGGVVGRGFARAVMICQLPWGPLDSETEFMDLPTFRDTFAPAGFDRTSAAYLMATKFPWPELAIIRVLGANPVKAYYQIQDSQPVNSLKAEALCYGAAGNGITVVIAAATDAVSNHFNMTAEKVDSATGEKTTEIYENVDSTQAVGAAYWTTLTASSKLLGPLTRGAGNRPPNGTYTLASGSDGSTIAASNYIGTAGSADKGCALLEKDEGADFIFTDDPGSSILAAVNAGLKAHEALMDDGRIVFTQGLAAESLSTAQTNVALNADDGTAYVFGHCTVKDDTQTSRTIPLTGPTACLASTITPHLSPAIKLPQFTKVLAAITSIDVSATKATKKACEKANIICYEKNSDGVFSPYCAPLSDGTAFYVKRMDDWIAFSMAAALEQFRNGPNDDIQIRSERTVIENFLGDLKRNGQNEQTRLLSPSIKDFALLPTESVNSAASIAAGDIKHAYQVVIAAEQKRIFLISETGTGVVITAKAA